MMDLHGKRVLITGGTSGIGLALATQALRLGAGVLVTGRRAAAVDAALAQLQAEGDKVHGVAADVSTSAGRAITLAAARQELGGLDVLVNNAGAVRAGRLETLADTEIEAMVGTNLLGPIFLTRDAVPMLRASGDALVVNVSSGIGLVAMPFYAVYAAVKAGVARFGDAMRRELHGEGVGVLNVYPTATDTPMMKAGNRAVPMDDADAVALAIVEAIAQGRREVIRGGDARLQLILEERSTPEALDARFAAMKPTLERAIAGHNAL
jgi:NAD(P)-dependent dehydrogenase (short-subunit alcohol dehydrogenase family)